MENNNSEDNYSRNLFNLFSRELPSFYKNKKFAPFHFCYWWFSTRKIDKKTSRLVMKNWCENKLCNLKPYHGIQID